MVVNEPSSEQQFRFVLPGRHWSAPQAALFLETLAAALAALREHNAYVVASGSPPPACRTISITVSANWRTA